MPRVANWQALAGLAMILGWLPVAARTLVLIGPTAAVRGSVTDGAGSPVKPLFGAAVVLSSLATHSEFRTVSDQDGQFSFGNVPPGIYTLRASRPGYLPAFYGEHRPGRALGTELVVEEGELLLSPMGVFRGGTISGTLTRGVGGRLIGASTVTAIEVPTSSEKTRYYDASSRWARARSRVDDRGAYRIAELPPGRYLVLATPDGEEAQNGSVPVPTYYPNALRLSEAETVVVGVGEDQSGINVMLVAEAIGQMAGLVRPSNGRWVPGWTGRVTASRLSQDPSTMVQRSGALGGDGAFHLTNLPVGDYRVTATVSVPVATVGEFSGVALFGAETVHLGVGSVASVSVLLGETSSVGGRTLATAAANRCGDGLSIILRGVTRAGSPGQFASRVQSDGSFLIRGVPGGVYRISAGGPLTDPGGSCALQSVTRDGRNVPLSGLEIREGERIPDLLIEIGPPSTMAQGFLRRVDGQPTFEYLVVAVPVEPGEGGNRLAYAVRPRSDGRFLVKGMPAGEYFLAAIADLDESMIVDERLLSSLTPGAIRIRIRPGEVTQQDLVLRR